MTISIYFAKVTACFDKHKIKTLLKNMGVLNTKGGEKNMPSKKNYTFLYWLFALLIACGITFYFTAKYYESRSASTELYLKTVQRLNTSMSSADRALNAGNLAEAEQRLIEVDKLLEGCFGHFTKDFNALADRYNLLKYPDLLERLKMALLQNDLESAKMFLAQAKVMADELNLNQTELAGLAFLFDQAMNASQKP